jgi:hypothetical protein
MALIELASEFRLLAEHLERAGLRAGRPTELGGGLMPFSVVAGTVETRNQSTAAISVSRLAQIDHTASAPENI